MTLTDKLSHAAERKAFETILDNLIKKGQTQDAAQTEKPEAAPEQAPAGSGALARA